MPAVRGVKGTFSAIIASAAIILLLFSSQSALVAQDSHATVVKMQLAKETALQTENLVRILDNATADVLYDNLSGGCNIPGNMAGALQTVIDDTITNFNTQSMAITCVQTEFIYANLGNDQMSLQFKLTCANSEKEGFTVEDIRTLKFAKHTETVVVGGGPPQCFVKDSVSQCREKPNFDGAVC